MPISDLAALIAKTPAGRTLELSGIYQLTAPLIVDRPLTLEGSAAQGAKVTAAFSETMVRFVGPGPWRLEGVAFEHGREPSRGIVEVDGGALTASGCSFCGAARRFERAASAGLSVVGKAKAQLDHCELSNNQRGLCLGDDASAEVIACRFANNRRFGLRVNGRAQVVVSDSVFTDNGTCGLALFDACTAQMTGGHCCFNGYHGIQVGWSSRAELIDVECDCNEGAGILAAGDAVATIRGARCHHNNSYGIAVQRRAVGELIGAATECNLVDGIVVCDTAHVAARANVSRGNGACGANVIDEADCAFSDNAFTHNGAAGLAFRHTSRGVAVGNDCRDNRRYGMWMSAAAQVELDDNQGELARESDGAPEF